MIGFYAKAIAVNAATAVLVTFASEKAVELYNKIPNTSVQNIFFKHVDMYKLDKVSREEPSASNHPSM